MPEYKVGDLVEFVRNTEVYVGALEDPDPLEIVRGDTAMVMECIEREIPLFEGKTMTDNNVHLFFFKASVVGYSFCFNDRRFRKVEVENVLDT